MMEDIEQIKTFADWTTCFERVPLLPHGVVPIAICGCRVPGWKFPRFPKLAPKRWFWKEWEKTHDQKFYVHWFNEEVLRPLDPVRTWYDLWELAGGRTFALVCFEPPGEFCHRHLVADWFRKAGFEMEEF